MNPLVAQLTGRCLAEDVPVPVAAKSPTPLRRRDRSNVRRRTAAAIMGLGEGEESIIPDDAEELEQHNSTDVKLNKDLDKEDKEAKPPTAPADGGEESSEDANNLIPPRAALVAPDVTPHTLEPIDPSEVPAPKTATMPRAPQGSDANVDPLSVLLGRTNRQAQEAPPAEVPVTTESVQASINASLNVGSSGGDLLGQGREMPAPQQGDTKKIMEAFLKFGPARKAQW